MRIFQGKLNTNTSYATENEVITLVTDSGFRVGTTVAITGQWTLSSQQTPKANYIFTGSISKLEGETIEIFKGQGVYYWFEGAYKDDKLTLSMKKEGDDNYGNAELSLVFTEA
ncbi:uncharacterized protein BJX67DRAFT_380683 [Aspergillus lucknowensis]|uniref:Uncharacterized protein n=1 Tax=Aspergillus lucknowensis TaxID=176173 RepID=A0ABR4LT68_9EURO